MDSIRKKLAGKHSKLATVWEKSEDHPAALNSYQDGEFFNVDIEMVNPDPDQPRKIFDPEGLAELSESIKQKGILQPVIIRKDENGKIILVAGERRFRAAKMACLSSIPAIMTKGNPTEIAIIENLQREDLKPIEEAEALGKMIDEYHYTHEQLASVIGKSRSRVTEILSIYKLPASIKEECRPADIFTRNVLVEVAKQKTPEKMSALLKLIKEGNLKSHQVRQITRKPNRSASRSAAILTLEKTQTLKKQLKNVNVESIEEGQRGPLLKALQELKLLVEKILSQNA